MLVEIEIHQIWNTYMEGKPAYKFQRKRAIFSSFWGQKSNMDLSTWKLAQQSRDVHWPKIFGPARPGPQFPGHFAARPGPQPTSAQPGPQSATTAQTPE